VIVPRPPGLYDPRFEHDACGIGFVADSAGRPSRAIVDGALEALGRVRHRGAVAADHRSGDGAGVLLPLPQGFFTDIDIAAPAGRVGVAVLFLPAGQDRERMHAIVEGASLAEGLEILGWRLVPVDPSALGAEAQASAPLIEQALLGGSAGIDMDELERRGFRARKRTERDAREARLQLYVASMSFRTITYKAMCAADQLAAFYADLRDPRFQASFCIFHQRYSTNTAPSWERSHPF